MRLLLLGTILLVGCNSNNKPDTGPIVFHPTSGRVTYDGQPAAGVEIVLLPVDAPGVPDIPRNPIATSGADGRYTIGTLSEADGAAEGNYIMVLSWPDPNHEAGDEEEGVNPDRLLGWYDPAHSDFKVLIKPGNNQIPTLELPKRTRPPTSSRGIPGRN